MAFRGTTVTFWKRSDGRLIGYRSQGHTGYAQSGTDIVCAAVSALTQTMLNGLTEVVKAPVTSSIDEEQALLEVRLTDQANPSQLENAQILLNTLLEGLRSIENSYPTNVRIYLKDWRSKQCSR